jgi:hypothetical protein
MLAYGCEGAGTGVLTPVKKPAGNQDLDTGTRTRNALLRDLRCRGERGFALLTQRWDFSEDRGDAKRPSENLGQACVVRAVRVCRYQVFQWVTCSAGSRLAGRKSVPLV